MTDTVLAWRPPIFKSFHASTNLLSAIFGHAFGVAVAFLTYDMMKEWLQPTDEEDPSLPLGLRRFILFVTAFLAGSISFCIMWFLFGLGYQRPHSSVSTKLGPM